MTTTIPRSYSMLLLTMGIINDRDYVHQSHDVNHLKLLIEQEFRSLNNNIKLCQTISRSITDYCQMCISTEGKRFDHLL